jgi:pimeloyl-ACP methyl ester carboxylesterase
MKDTLLSRLADRLILRPTTHRIPVDGKSRRELALGDDRIEVWAHRVRADWTDDVDVFVLKLVGAGGRAERATDQPVNYWPDVRAEIWAANPPGYGGSGGRASLEKMPAVAAAVYDELEKHAAGRPVVVLGSSFGGASALYLAAARPIDGLIVRNAPPLRQVILGRFGWWNLNFGARLIARQVPKELCAVRNAQRASAPAVFVMSEKDRIVPSRYQRLAIDAYAGRKRLLILPNADHITPMTDDETEQYGSLVGWLWTRVTASSERGESG